MASGMRFCKAEGLDVVGEAIVTSPYLLAHVNLLSGFCGEHESGSQGHIDMTKSHAFDAVKSDPHLVDLNA